MSCTLFIYLFIIYLFIYLLFIYLFIYLFICPEGRLRKLSFNRHDSAVKMIYDAVRRGYNGALQVSCDLGKQDENGDNDRTTLPKYLFESTAGADTTNSRKRPDIVVHYGFRAGDTYTAEECPDGNGPQQIPTAKKRIKLLEVSYTNIQNMRHREYEKRVKYEMTIVTSTVRGWMGTRTVCACIRNAGRNPSDSRKHSDRLRDTGS